MNTNLLQSIRPRQWPSFVRWCGGLAAVGCVLTNCDLDAHDINPAHRHLVFSSVATKYVVRDKDDDTKIEIDWIVLPPSSPTAKESKEKLEKKNEITHTYLVRVSGIKYPESDKKRERAYSLLSLGIQSENFIRAVTCYRPRPGTVGTVSFVEKENGIEQNLDAGAANKPDGDGWIVLSKSREIPVAKFGDDSLIAFFVLSGSESFEFQVVEKESMANPGLKRRKTTWGAREGHDNNPPKNPPD